MLASLLLWTPSFMVVAAFLLGVGVYELASAMRFAGRDVPRVPSVLVAVGVVPAAFLGGQIPALFTLLGGIVLISPLAPGRGAVHDPEAGRRQRLPRPDERVVRQAYITLLGACVVLLSAQRDGKLWVIAFILVVVAVDTGAYATGLNLGKHPMAPGSVRRRPGRASPAPSRRASSSASSSPWSCSGCRGGRASSSVCSSPGRPRSAT